MEPSLLTLFCTNFVAYYRTHAAHVNVVGRNFTSDHQLLDMIYSDLQGEIDVIAELLRTINQEMPETLAETLDNSMINDEEIRDFGTGIGYLTAVYDMLEVLIEAHLDLEDETNKDREYNHLANYAQDRVKKLQKFRWQLRATIEPRISSPEIESLEFH